MTVSGEYHEGELLPDLPVRARNGSGACHLSKGLRGGIMTKNWQSASKLSSGRRRSVLG
jgi:hypothetical protein